MNTLKGVITKKQTHEEISLIDINIKNDEFSSLIIETEATKKYIKVGNEIDMLFKETEISLKNYHDKLIKRTNKFIAKVISINKGVILSDVKLEYNNQYLRVISLTRHINELNLQIGKKAVMILRTQEILLSKRNS